MTAPRKSGCDGVKYFLGTFFAIHKGDPVCRWSECWVISTVTVYLKYLESGTLRSLVNNLLNSRILSELVPGKRALPIEKPKNKAEK